MIAEMLKTTPVVAVIQPMTTPVDILGERAPFGADCFKGNGVAEVSSFLLAWLMHQYSCCGRDLPSSTSGAHRSLPRALPFV
jgi:hypothetical protein